MLDTASFTTKSAFLKKNGVFLAVNCFFLIVFSGRGNSREWVVLGSMAPLSFLCTVQLGGRWSISSTALLAAVTLPGQLLSRGKRSTSKSQLLSDSSLPSLAYGEQTSTFLGGPAAVQTLQAQTRSRILMLGLCWNPVCLRGAGVRSCYRERCFFQVAKLKLNRAK